MPKRTKLPLVRASLVASAPLDEQVRELLLGPETLEALAAHPRGLVARLERDGTQAFLHLAVVSFPSSSTGDREQLTAELERASREAMKYLQGRPVRTPEVEILTEAEDGRGPVVDLLGSAHRLLRQLPEIDEKWTPALVDAFAAGWGLAELRHRHQSDEAASAATAAKRRKAKEDRARARPRSKRARRERESAELRAVNERQNQALVDAAREVLARGKLRRIGEVSVQVRKRTHDTRNPDRIARILRRLLPDAFPKRGAER